MYKMKKNENLIGFSIKIFDELIRYLCGIDHRHLT